MTLSSRAPGTVFDVTSQAVSGGIGGEAIISETYNDVDVEVPSDPAEPITLNSFEGDLASISLASVPEGAEPVTDASGLVGFAAEDFVTTPVVKTDGSVQIVTTIENADAPSAYDYLLEAMLSRSTSTRTVQ